MRAKDVNGRRCKKGLSFKGGGRGGSYKEGQHAGTFQTRGEVHMS